MENNIQEPLDSNNKNDESNLVNVSDKDLMNRLIANEDKFKTIDTQINTINNVITELATSIKGVVNHVNTVSTEINTAFTGIKNLLNNSKSQNKPEEPKTATELASTISQEPEMAPSNNPGVVGILDRLLNFYIMAKQSQPAPAPDPTQAFMGSIQTSVDLLRSMSNLVSGLKKDWIAEEKLVHNIEKTKNTLTNK